MKELNTFKWQTYKWLLWFCVLFLGFAVLPAQAEVVFEEDWMVMR